MPALHTAIPRPCSVRDLYRDFGGSVYAVAHRVLGRDDLAEEATRRTFERASQADDCIDGERDPAEWLATLAKVAAIEVSHERAVGSDDTDVNTLDAVWRVRRAIDQLPAGQGAVLRMQHVEGLGLSEIARSLHLPLGEVRTRSQHAHQHLAALLGRIGADDSI